MNFFDALPDELVVKILSNWSMSFATQSVCKRFADLNFKLDAVLFSHRGKCIKLFWNNNVFITVDHKYMKIYDILDKDVYYSDFKPWLPQILNKEKHIVYNNLKFSKFCFHNQMVAAQNSNNEISIGYLTSCSSQKNFPSLHIDPSFMIMRMDFVQDFLVVIATSCYDVHQYRVTIYDVLTFSPINFEFNFITNGDNLCWTVKQDENNVLIALSNLRISYFVIFNVETRQCQKFKLYGKLISIIKDKIYIYNSNKLHGMNVYTRKKFIKYSLSSRDIPICVSESVVWLCSFSSSKRFKIWCFLKASNTKLYLNIVTKRFPIHFTYSEQNEIFSFKETNKKITIGTVRCLHEI